MLNINSFLEKGVKALIFDLDGTLADTMPIHMKAWMSVGNKLDLPITEKDIYRLTGSPTKEVAKILAHEYGWELNPDEVSELKQDFYLKHKADHGKIQGIPFVHDLAIHYHNKMPLSVGTGSRRENAESIIEDIGLTGYFEAVVTATEITKPKPDPETFLRCAEKMKIAPEQCLVFEDGDMGIKAAVEGGMHYFDVRPFLKSAQSFLIHFRCFHLFYRNIKKDKEWKKQ